MSAQPKSGRPRSVALLLFAGYFGLLLWSAKDLGYARDEGFYFQAAQAYRGWFELLLADPWAALERGNIDRFWSANHEHPSLLKVAFMASHWLFFDVLGWLREPGTAYRLPGMLMSAWGVALVYLWGRRVYGAAAGLFAAVSFAALPRVFYHAHLACFDAPVTTMWLLTLYVYAKSLEAPGQRGYLLTGLCYGLLLETKHNAWLLPAVLFLHQLTLLVGDAIAGRRRARPLLPKAWFAMALLGPLVFYALWPWLWFDPVHRFIEYFQFHAHHDYYNMEFLGRTYWKPPMPLGYAWLMTFATVPAITLLAFLVGAFLVLGAGSKAVPVVDSPSSASGTGALWLLSILVSYAPWMSENTPIFGGTKHWMTAYPPLCLVAGYGFAFAFERARAALPSRLPAKARTALVGSSLLAGPVVMAAHSHPFGLTFYTPLVGGAAGAATLGLNRTFWGYTTGSLTGFLNQHTPPDASVYVHDTALPSFDMLRLDGRLREDIRGTLAIHQSRVALYHHEPHMGRVEYQIWVDYGTTVPSTIVCYDGVPVVWVYERP